MYIYCSDSWVGVGVRFSSLWMMMWHIFLPALPRVTVYIRYYAYTPAPYPFYLLPQRDFSGIRKDGTAPKSMVFNPIYCVLDIIFLNFPSSTPR